MLRRYRIKPELTLMSCWVDLHCNRPSSRSHATIRRRLASRPSSEGTVRKRYHSVASGIKVLEPHVQKIAGWTNHAGVFHFGCNFVMDNSLLILANNVDTKFEMILGLEFVRFRLSVFLRESSPIHKCTVGRLDVPDPNLAAAIRPNFSVLPRQHFTVEETVDWGRNCFRVRLAANP